MTMNIHSCFVFVWKCSEVVAMIRHGDFVQADISRASAQCGLTIGLGN